MVYSIRTQDLMTVGSEYAICHCISVDCAMGKGVVVPIKAKYTGIKERCREFVKSVGPANALGQAYRDESDVGVVYNLFSKYNVWDNVEKLPAGVYMEHLKSCLISMRDKMIDVGEKKLAMPKIACGLDRCKWEDVERLILEVFGDTDIEVLVCVL